MKWIDTLDRKFGRYHLPFVTETIIAGQVVFYALSRSDASVIGDMSFVWHAATTGGEWWRFFTFVFIPPLSNPIFAFFAWYLFYLMGTALDNHWGTFRYNLFLLIAYAATIGAAAITPDAAVSNVYIGGSVFLAFAWLYPDFELLLFFILPIKVKWLALVAWLLLGWTVLSGSLTVRLTAVASVLNFLIFFSGDIILRLRSGKRRMVRQAEAFADRSKAFHTCAVCGKTDKAAPDEDFRYANGPDGPLCFCSEHFPDHEKHIAAMATKSARQSKKKEKW